ncbi:hypothetical protein WMY93_027979 [Mugilogobius chulae]|uniref:Receptor ligand binding region domain-containing protein n=1 Tax=Mugilogobius chulae TaxID=88201 RepID=A0AAW0MVJ7_9GOBI
MRFSIEEINNSSSLLPGVTLGYNIFDHCSDTQNIPCIFNLLSGKDPMNPWAKASHIFPKITALIGAFTSPVTRTVAPMFMTHLIPMISYGAASSIFSLKHVYPSFLRTVHPNKDVVEIIVQMLLYFKWHWVAFLNIDNDYGNDGYTVFIKMIRDTDICLAYTKKLDKNTDYNTVFEQIENQRIQVIIVFAPEWTVEELIPSAMQMKVTNKTWIAVDSWALNKKLPKMPGIQSIGTVLGIAEPEISIPGFDDFISTLQIKISLGNFVTNDILKAENSFNFPVYAAVYAIAHALHNTLQCGDKKCNKSITLYPHMLLSQLKKLNFTLLDHTILFDTNGDPRFGYFNIITWNSSGEAETVGIYTFQSAPHFSINESKIQWHTKGKEAILCVELPAVPADEILHRKINNSSSLLPGVTLGYNIIDHCSDTPNIPDMFSLLSGKDPINPWATPRHSFSKITALVGPFTSPVTRTVAPLFTTQLIPMISYSATSSIFSLKQVYPSFLRTVHPNKDMVEIIVQMLLYFKWNWVAFLNIDNDYGNDGYTVFIKMIRDTDIYYNTVFEQIENLNIKVIIVFAPEWTVEELIPSAMQMKVTNKTWIAVDAWALNKKLPKMPGIQSIGTVLGIAEPVISMPGFDDFISTLQIKNQPGEFCNQFCNCSDLRLDDILKAESSFNFPVYAAVYAIAHALHNTLQCGGEKCNKNITLYPHMVLSELRRSKFTLLDHTILFDKNGDPRFGHFNIITWNSSGEAETVGIYTFQSAPHFPSMNPKYNGTPRDKFPHRYAQKNVHLDIGKVWREFTNAVLNVWDAKKANTSTCQQTHMHVCLVGSRSGRLNTVPHASCARGVCPIQ